LHSQLSAEPTPSRPWPLARRSVHARRPPYVHSQPLPTLGSRDAPCSPLRPLRPPACPLRKYPLLSAATGYNALLASLAECGRCFFWRVSTSIDSLATLFRFRAFAEEEEEEDAAPAKKAPAKPAEKYKISGDYKAGKTCGGGSSGGWLRSVERTQRWRRARQRASRVHCLPTHACALLARLRVVLI
jgi:hypothetical protein